MYNVYNEVIILYNLFLNYMSNQKKAVDFFNTSEWKKYQSNDELEYHKERFLQSQKIVSALSDIKCFLENFYCNDKFSLEKYSNNSTFVNNSLNFIKNNSNYISIMSEIAHNTYFNEKDNLLTSFQLPEEQIFDALSECYRDGYINQANYILFNNYFEFLCNDPDYIDLVNKNKSYYYKIYNN